MASICGKNGNNNLVMFSKTNMVESYFVNIIYILVYSGDSHVLLFFDERTVYVSIRHGP